MANRPELKSLPKFEEEPEYAQKIKENQTAYKRHTIAELATEFFEARKRKKVFEERLADSNLLIAALEGLILAALEDSDVSMIRLEGSDASIFRKSTAYPKVVDKKALFAWIKANKATHLVGVMHQSLKSFVNERLQAGESLPPGVVAFLKDSLGHRGSNA